jgi:hypothetical protein
METACGSKRTTENRTNMIKKEDQTWLDNYIFRLLRMIRLRC